MVDKIDFFGGDTATYREEYLERIKYKKIVNLDGLIDIWYKNYDYGLLNQAGEPVVLLESDDLIKGFDGVGEGVRAINFVSDAFTKFRQKYIEKVNNSTLGFPPYMDGLIPKKGHVSFEDLYANWQAYSATKYSAFLEGDVRIKDYSSFMVHLKQQLKVNLKEFPITRSGFCLSSHNDIKTSGLVIELTNLNPNIDFYKGEIVQTLEFKCFLDLAVSYGFYVDKNAPWRLMSNLDDPITRLFIRGLDTDSYYREAFSNPNISKQAAYDSHVSKDARHKDRTTREILNNLYRIKTHYDDIFSLKDFVLRVYSGILSNVPYYTEMKYNSATNRIEKQNVFRESTSIIPKEELFDLLVMVRLLEVDRYSLEDHERISKKVLNILNNPSLGFRVALGCIGAELAKMTKEDFTTVSINDRIEDNIESNETTTERTNINATTTRIFTNPNSGY